MALFVLSDTHLSLSTGKPMDVFGERWKDHTARIEHFFKTEIKEEDTVVIPGDISWGLTLAEALPDLLFLDRLPGKKILGKGNHDYWWGTTAKVQKLFLDNGITKLSLLFNNAYRIGDVAVCGTRGWFSETASPAGVDRPKIVAREAGRLRRSLEAGKATGARELIAFLHFPPVFGEFLCPPLLDVLKQYGVRRCYYGHLHGQYHVPPCFSYDGIDFYIAAADHLQFRPLPVISTRKPGAWCSACSA